MKSFLLSISKQRKKIRSLDRESKILQDKKESLKSKINMQDKRYNSYHVQNKMKILNSIAISRNNYKKVCIISRS